MVDKERRADVARTQLSKDRRAYVEQARADEKRRREAAQAAIADVEPGGREVAGRSMKQMVSVRLEAQLLKELRELAEQQGLSISDLLRQAALELVERTRTTPVQVFYHRAEAHSPIVSAITAGMQITSGFPTVSEDAQLSGNDFLRALTTT